MLYQSAQSRLSAVLAVLVLIAKHRINPRISADWSSTKPIATFSCTPRVEEVHTKADVVHPTHRLSGNIQYLPIGNVLRNI